MAMSQPPEGSTWYDNIRQAVTSAGNNNVDQIMRSYFVPHNTGNNWGHSKHNMALHSVEATTQPGETVPAASTRSYVPIYPPSGVKCPGEKDEACNNEATWRKTDTYNPRRTGWYTNAVAGPKDVFILADQSGMDVQAQALLKSTLNEILQTISPNDNIYMMRKTSKHDGKNMNFTSTLLDEFTSSCGSSTSRGTADMVRRLSSAVNNMAMPPALEGVQASSSPEEWMNMLGYVFQEANKRR
jgi:hypothetical protein